MFKLHPNIKPKSISAIACSGGIDSMVLLDFLNKNHKRDVLFFHHGTETSEKAFHFLTDYCARKEYNLVVGRIESTKIIGSAEAFWREHRYKFLNAYNGNVATAHHLNDAVETWLFTSFHGNGRVIPPINKNVVRPFILVPKSEIVKYQAKHNIPYIDDKTNNDVCHARNRIRNNIMKEVLKINPGINKVIFKKYVN
jgi:tRNA(Ile)-lysidine synthase